MLRRQIGRIASVLALVSGVVLATTTSAQAATPCPNWGGVPSAGAISNKSSIPLGVIHLADNNCSHPYYDVRLDPGEDTYHDVGWSEVAAAYIPRGYGARVWEDGVRRADYLPSRSYNWFDAGDGGRDWTLQLYCGGFPDVPC